MRTLPQLNNAFIKLAWLGLAMLAFSLQDSQADEIAFGKVASRTSDPVPSLNNPALTLPSRDSLRKYSKPLSGSKFGEPFAAQSRDKLATFVGKSKQGQ